jgi:hypothetical protein
MARDNVMVEGESKVIEIPLSGHLAEFWEDSSKIHPDFPFYIAERFRRRWESRHRQRVDVFEIFWHPCELLVRAKASEARDEATIHRLTEILCEVADWDGVVFSTVHAAAMDWQSTVEPDRSAAVRPERPAAETEPNKAAAGDADKPRA